MRRRSATLALFALLALSCRSPREREALPAEDQRACASACAALVTARCPSDEPTEARQSACLDQCRRAELRAKRAGCAREQRAYLGCVSTARIECRSKSETAANALEHALGVVGCEPLHATYFACTEPCREQGVVRTGATELPRDSGTATLKAELVLIGCVEPFPRMARGAPPGSPCTHHSVCAAERCECSAGRPGYFARACLEDRCAARPEACALAPRAVGYRPCR